MPCAPGRQHPASAAARLSWDLSTGCGAAMESQDDQGPAVLLHDVRNGQSKRVLLPLRLLGVMAWSPASDAVLCVESQTALFVCPAGPRVRRQHVRTLPHGTTSVAWGSAGCAAVSGVGDDGLGSMVVCTTGSPPYRLQLLHRLAPDSLVISLCFEPAGRLLFWAAQEHARRSGSSGGWRAAGPGAGQKDIPIMAGPVRVSVAQLASADCRVISTLHSADCTFSPFLRAYGASVQLRWSSAGLLIMGPLEDTGLRGPRGAIMAQPLRVLRFTG